MKRAWLGWTLLAVTCWGVWALLSKLIGEALSPSAQGALSTLGLLPVIAALGLSQKLTITGRRGRGILLALTAGLLACLGNIAYYDVLGRGSKAATVIPLTAMYPLVTILLALILLKERLNRIQLAGVGLSLAAIYCFNFQQDGGFLSPWLLLALVPIGFWGVSALLQKLTTNHLSGELSTLWFLVAFIPVGALLLWQQPVNPWPGAKTWLLVVGLGLSFALGNLALLIAFARDGKASVIAPLSGLYSVVSIPLAFLVLGERTGVRESIGILLALLAVVALAWEGRAHSSPASGEGR